MSSSDKSDIRQKERDLFANMAKVRQPMAPDLMELDPLDPDELKIMLCGFTPEDFAEANKAEIKARFPGFTPSQLKKLANF